MLPSRSDALSGVRVALLEARMSGEMGELVRRYGGTPRFAPSVHETPVDSRDSVAEFLRSLEGPAARMVVFLTGVGATALFDEADRQGRLPFLLDSLRHATLVCRGPKPSSAIKRRGLSPSIVARDPYTSAEVLEAMPIDLAGAQVALVHYGETNDALAAMLRARGAKLTELCLYQWRLPDNTKPMRDLIADLLAGDVDAVVFTSQIQARHLLQIASDTGIDSNVVAALNTKSVVASVGPICTAALEAAGIRPQVVPDNPKMAPLIAALAEHFDKIRSTRR